MPRVPSLPFLWPKSKADTLNAMNDIDLNLWGVRVILMGVCVCVSGTERRSGGLWRGGRRSLCSSRAQSEGASSRSALPYNAPWGSLSDCVTENRWTASLRLVFYIFFSIMIYRAILLSCHPTITCAVLLKAACPLLLYLVSFEVPKS